MSVWWVPTSFSYTCILFFFVKFIWYTFIVNVKRKIWKIFVLQKERVYNFLQRNILKIFSHKKKNKKGRRWRLWQQRRKPQRRRLQRRQPKRPQRSAPPRGRRNNARSFVCPQWNTPQLRSVFVFFETVFEFFGKKKKFVWNKRLVPFKNCEP